MISGQLLQYWQRAGGNDPQAGTSRSTGFQDRATDLCRSLSKISASFSLLAGLLAFSLHTKPVVSQRLGPWLLARVRGIEPRSQGFGGPWITIFLHPYKFLTKDKTATGIEPISPHCKAGRPIH